MCVRRCKNWRQCGSVFGHIHSFVECPRVKVIINGWLKTSLTVGNFILKMASKKRKSSMKCCGSWRLFHEEWTLNCGVIEQNNKAFCCLCNGTITARFYNIKRRFESDYGNLCSLTYDERTEIIRRTVKLQEQKCKTFQSIFKPKNNISEASF